MGLMSKSFFRRRQLRKSKKLSDSLASLDNLQTQVDETYSYEEHLQLQHCQAETRLQNALKARKALLERINEKFKRLKKVNDDILKMDTAMTKVMEKNRENLDACRQLELYHKELPNRSWSLQVQLSRAFRSIQETKEKIDIASSTYRNCSVQLDIKREELLMSQIQTKSIKERIFSLKTQLQKFYDSKKIKEFHQRTLEAMITYVMQMNLRAVNSRSIMIHRRGKHLQKMLKILNSELTQYMTLSSDLRKRKYRQTRHLEMIKSLSSTGVEEA